MPISLIHRYFVALENVINFQNKSLKETIKCDVF